MPITSRHSIRRATHHAVRPVFVSERRGGAGPQCSLLSVAAAGVPPPTFRGPPFCSPWAMPGCPLRACPALLCVWTDGPLALHAQVAHRAMDAFEWRAAHPPRARSPRTHLPRLCVPARERAPSSATRDESPRIGSGSDVTCFVASLFFLRLAGGCLVPLDCAVSRDGNMEVQWAPPELR